MNKLVNAVSLIQSQIEFVPYTLRKVSRDEGTVTVTAYSPGSQREEDTSTFSIVFVVPDEYPESQVWFMSDDEAISDMLSAVAEEFMAGATLEVLLAHVLTLLGHEPEHFSNLFLPASNTLDGEDELTDDCVEDGSDAKIEKDKDLMLELGGKRGRWEKSKSEFRETTLQRKKSKQESSSKENLAEDRQIFDATLGFKLLSNELLSIMREEACDMIVDTVNNDVYHWIVKLAGFENSSLLAEDLVELRKRYGYSTIQLHVIFKRDLHPFYPPRVEVLRPRFIGPIGSAISSHTIFALRHWDRWRSQKQLLAEIKNFFQRHARVDFQSKYNSLVQHPDAAYSPAEIQLARFDALSEIVPRWATFPEYKPLYVCQEVRVDSERTAALSHGGSNESNPNPPNDAQKAKEEYWAAGTGYGHGYSKGQNKENWDTKKATDAQNAHDIEVQTLLDNLTKSLSSELEANSTELSNDGEASEATDPIGLIPTLNASCLVPFLTKELDNASFTNMCERASYYLSIIKLVNELCRPICARMLHSATSDDKCVLQCLEDIKDQAKRYTRVIIPYYDPMKIIGIPVPSLPEDKFALAKSWDIEESMGLNLAESIINCVESLKYFQYSDSSEEERVEAGSSSTETQIYEKIMKAFQIDFHEDLVTNHSFGQESNRETAFPKDRLARLGREIAGLNSLLPLHPSSSTFVRVDEQKQMIWTAMIVEPEDTPYSGGCFIFDIYFPTSYPHSPPKVLFKTTGGGKVRFNPNLYKCGKVCLSLLGNWSGSASEKWNPSASSICQVLISIQSLILVNEPVFNEPGYRHLMHSESGKDLSRSFNQEIREHTIHRAMIEHLRNPSGPFADVILTHFKLRKGDVLETCRQWVREREAMKETANASRLKTLVSELEELLNSIPQ